MRKRKENIIWQNIDLDIEKWDFDPEDNLTDDQKYEAMYEDNNMCLDDERCNLNIELSGKILVIASLGLWDGRRSGYKIIGNNIRDILYSNDDTIKWYADGKNVKAVAHHHDGTNYYEYREIRNEKEGIDKLLSKLANGEPVSRKEINRYTKSIRPYVAEIYGW